MLNKDQYNQEEYNDYYRQETEGAEIKGSYKKEGKGKKPIVILLSLLLLGIAGYFGFSKLNTSATIDTNKKEVKVTKVEDDSSITSERKKEKIVTETKVIEEKADLEQQEIKEKDSTKTVQTESTSNEKAETKVTTAIEKSIDSSQKMSPEEIAKVVQLVMSQMNQNSNENISSEGNGGKSDNEGENTTEDVTNDTDLLNALSESMVDTITESEKKDYSITENNKNIEVKEKKETVDTYNKVTIQTTSGSDELSRLSEQISSVIQETENTTSTISSPSSTTYTESITKEVAERSNAMRIIIVKRGDTLGKIAKRAYGNSMAFKKIYMANPDLINRPDRIYVGQKLRIPE